MLNHLLCFTKSHNSAFDYVVSWLQVSGAVRRVGGCALRSQGLYPALGSGTAAQRLPSGATQSSWHLLNFPRLNGGVGTACTVVFRWSNLYINIKEPRATLYI